MHGNGNRSWGNGKYTYRSTLEEFPAQETPNVDSNTEIVRKERSRFPLSCDEDSETAEEGEDVAAEHTVPSTQMLVWDRE